jgi:hypothetical protein
MKAASSVTSSSLTSNFSTTTFFTRSNVDIAISLP